MVGLVFFLLIGIGIYLLLRSRYKDFSVGMAIGYSMGIFLCLAGIVLIASTVRNMRFRPHAVLHAAVNAAVGDQDIQIIEINADDLDPQIQEALLEAARRRARRQELTTDDLLKQLEHREPPQEGVCGVCYDVLESGDLLGCPACHKSAHKPCLKEWIESGQNVCIYCRHDLVPT